MTLGQLTVAQKTVGQMTFGQIAIGQKTRIPPNIFQRKKKNPNGNRNVSFRDILFLSFYFPPFNLNFIVMKFSSSRLRTIVLGRKSSELELLEPELRKSSDWGCVEPHLSSKILKSSWTMMNLVAQSVSIYSVAVLCNVCVPSGYFQKQHRNILYYILGY